VNPKSKIFLLIFVLAGCKTLPVANQELERNSRLQNQNEQSLVDAAAGFVQGAKEANAVGATAVVSEELDLAAAALPQPSPKTAQAAKERVASAIAGDESAEQRYAAAWGEVQELRTVKQFLQVEREQLHQQLETALSGKLAAETKLREGAESRAELIKTVIRTLMIVGGAAAVAGVLAFRLFPSLALPLAFLSGACFGLAYLAAVVQPWMVYTIGGLALITGGAIAFYAYRERRLANGAIGFVQEQRNEDESWWKSKKQAATQWLGDGKGWLGSEIDRRTREMNLS